MSYNFKDFLPLRITHCQLLARIILGSLGSHDPIFNDWHIVTHCIPIEYNNHSAAPKIGLLVTSVNCRQARHLTAAKNGLKNSFKTFLRVVTSLCNCSYAISSFKAEVVLIGIT